MKVKRTLSLEAASGIVDAALQAGRDHKMSPLAVVVLDGGGIPVAFKSEDGCGIIRFDVAMGKAYGALGMGSSSRGLRDRLSARPIFAGSLSVASDGRFIPTPGGVLIVDADGMAIGAVGISGDVSDKDEYCAIVGIHHVGLASEPAEASPTWAD